MGSCFQYESANLKRKDNSGERRVDERVKKNCFACCLLRAGFLLRLFFDHEDGGDIFIRNVG
jgi:hypothetical protein